MITQNDVRCDTIEWVLMCEDRGGQTVGLHEYTDEAAANRAFDVAIAAKVCLYKQVCETTLVKSKSVDDYGNISS